MSNYKQNILAITLPVRGGDGKRVRKALQKVANENRRTLSNQVFEILMKYLKEEGRI